MIVHRYVSTGCLHGRHDYCQSMTGYQGTKRPGTCKFCDARCLCVCHSNEMIMKSVEGNEMGVVKGTAKTAGTLVFVDVLVKVGAAIAAVLVAVKAIKALRGN